ncbi:MAG TPA: glycosyltransferase [Ferruginibacter sp.]|nr:glycosyltransferase [Ferruginibacter sp.]HMP19437.1 glycosyltransferase [Ferruginibacter sp.]
MKKTILHIIDNLGRGGAETMLVKVVKQLPDYRHVIVTLHPENEFGAEVECAALYCLHLGSKLKAPLAAMQLRRIIKKENVQLVHSHLFWSSVIARMGVPAKIPLYTTIHAFVASSIEYRPWRMRLIEKLTYKIRKSTIIAVAKGALKEYFSFINLKPHDAHCLYTFVDTGVFNNSVATTKKCDDTFRIVSVGNLKEQKNQRFLLEAFTALKHENITLDIYGKGPLEEELQQYINQHNIKVTLKGQATDIQNQLGQYDLFVMSSLYEGFALSVLEAMALGMPLLLSNISSFKEQCGDTAAYYNLDDKNDFTEKLLALKNSPLQLEDIGAAAKIRVLNNFTLQKHITRLKALYNNAVDNSRPAMHFN